MPNRIFIFLVVVILNFTVPGLAQTEPLHIPDLDSLALPEEMAARVSNVLPSKPGDTFVHLRNGMTVLIRENHASRVVTTQILVKTGSIYEDNYFFGGLSHYLEHVVSGGSTRSFNETEAQKTLKYLGGDSNAYTSYDQTA